MLPFWPGLSQNGCLDLNLPGKIKVILNLITQTNQNNFTEAINPALELANDYTQFLSVNSLFTLLIKFMK